MPPTESTPRTTVPFSLRLPPDLRQRLEQQARVERRSLTNLIVHALYDYLSRVYAMQPPN